MFSELFDSPEEFERELESIQESGGIEYKDPMALAPQKNTESQNLIWNHMKEHEGTGSVYALIGAKGSAKTHLGCAYDLHKAQKYPGSLGCIASNTFGQAKDSAGAILSKIARKLDYNINFFTTKNIRGRAFTNLYVIDLDGEGWNRGQVSYILVRSFDAVSRLEGAELDYLHCEEVQDANMADFVTAVSRVRGAYADNGIFIAGMPEDEYHWQYDLIPKMVKRKKYANRWTDYSDAEYEKLEADNGIFRMPALKENLHNVGREYIERLRTIYDEETARRYIEGKPVSLSGNKVFYRFSAHAHVKSRMSQVLTDYDPKKPLHFSFDFNVSPMSVTVWQIKEWNDKWGSTDLVISDDGSVTKLFEEDQDEEYESLTDYAEPDRQVLAQVDEFEVWNGGTEKTCQHIMAAYGDHMAGGSVLGDASGNSRDTRSSTTDWQIIMKYFSQMPNMEIIQGLVQNMNINSGTTKYSNPDKRDTINIANRLLRDHEDKVHVCFLPQSKYGSDGAGKSVGSLKHRPDGNIDDSNDKKEGRDIPRTHFADTFRYICYWYNGGSDLTTLDEQDAAIEEALRRVTGGSKSRWGNRGGRATAFGF